ncbi:hypothetical protein Tco_0999178, partial [Tanacetum coccineum]
VTLLMLLAANVSDTAPWKDLKSHVGEIEKTHLRDLMNDADRCKSLMLFRLCHLSSGIMQEYGTTRASIHFLFMLRKLESKLLHVCKGLSKGNDDVCSVCNQCVNEDVRSNDHLFFACNTAKKISKLINRWWDVPFMDINSYGEWRSWIDNVKMPKKNKSMFQADDIVAPMASTCATPSVPKRATTKSVIRHVCVSNKVIIEPEK